MFPDLATTAAQAKGRASALGNGADEWGGRMQLRRESRMLRRIAAQMGPTALGLEVNTHSLTSFSNRVFKAMN